MYSQPIEGVYLSSLGNLKEQFDREFQSVSNILVLKDPNEISDPLKIRFALSWDPPDDAFTPYPNIEMVSSIGAGVDSILRCPSLSDDAIVTRVRDPQQAFSMAGFVAWQVVWYHRRMKQYLLNENNHTWNWVDSVPLKDCKIGILGFGTMGQATAKALLSLGYHVIVACRTKRNNSGYHGLIIESGEKSIQNTAANSNILINLLPLTKATCSILNASLFSLMPNKSVLIQVGRGDHLVDEDLIEALDRGKLSAASLDVFRKEPLIKNNSFWDDPRILVTPHIACETSRVKVVEQVTECLLDIINLKTPRYAINREQEY